jgi:23S rRNA (uracil1939-C5)-methyltransferase
MELTFGNAEKDGPLTLGLHKRGSFYDIITVSNCKLMDEDFIKITNFTIDFFKRENLNFYHKMKHEGFLRNLVLRKGEFTGELLINLITTSELDYNMEEWKNGILNLELSNNIIGLLWTVNDNRSDTVNSESEKILYGVRDFHERLMGYEFIISPYSFFQTNSSGAELLYSKVLEFLPDTRDKVIFDLFSGTGTIGQIVSKNAGYVYGIELIEEAVTKANENAKLNNINNCRFIAGDVFKKVEELSAENISPDIVIFDPPRPGVGQKALEKILEFNMNAIIYVSCNPKTFVQDVEILMGAGFEMSKSICVDMFPNTPHVEIVSLLEKRIDNQEKTVL